MSYSQSAVNTEPLAQHGKFSSVNQTQGILLLGGSLFCESENRQTVID